MADQSSSNTSCSQEEAPAAQVVRFPPEEEAVSTTCLSAGVRDADVEARH